MRYVIKLSVMGFMLLLAACSGSLDDDRKQPCPAGTAGDDACTPVVLTASESSLQLLTSQTTPTCFSTQVAPGNLGQKTNARSADNNIVTVQATSDSEHCVSVVSGTPGGTTEIIIASEFYPSVSIRIPVLVAQQAETRPVVTTIKTPSTIDPAHIAFEASKTIALTASSTVGGTPYTGGFSWRIVSGTSLEATSTPGEFQIKALGNTQVRVVPSGIVCPVDKECGAALNLNIEASIVLSSNGVDLSRLKQGSSDTTVTATINPTPSVPPTFSLQCDGSDVARCSDLPSADLAAACIEQTENSVSIHARNFGQCTLTVASSGASKSQSIMVAPGIEMHFPRCATFAPGETCAIPLTDDATLSVSVTPFTASLGTITWEVTPENAVNMTTSGSAIHFTAGSSASAAQTVTISASSSLYGSLGSASFQWANYTGQFALSAASTTGEHVVAVYGVSHGGAPKNALRLMHVQSAVLSSSTQNTISSVPSALETPFVMIVVAPKDTSPENILALAEKKIVVPTGTPSVVVTDETTMVASTIAKLKSTDDALDALHLTMLPWLMQGLTATDSDKALATVASLRSKLATESLGSAFIAKLATNGTGDLFNPSATAPNADAILSNPCGYTGEGYGLTPAASSSDAALARIALRKSLCMSAYTNIDGGLSLRRLTQAMERTIFATSDANIKSKLTLLWKQLHIMAEVHFQLQQVANVGNTLPWVERMADGSIDTATAKTRMVSLNYDQRCIDFVGATTLTQQVRNRLKPILAKLWDDIYRTAISGASIDSVRDPAVNSMYVANDDALLTSLQVRLACQTNSDGSADKTIFSGSTTTFQNRLNLIQQYVKFGRAITTTADGSDGYALSDATPKAWSLGELLAIAWVIESGNLADGDVRGGSKDAGRLVILDATGGVPTAPFYAQTNICGGGMKLHFDAADTLGTTTRAMDPANKVPSIHALVVANYFEIHQRMNGAQLTRWRASSLNTTDFTGQWVRLGAAPGQSSVWRETFQATIGTSEVEHGSSADPRYSALLDLAQKPDFLTTFDYSFWASDKLANSCF